MFFIRPLSSSLPPFNLPAFAQAARLEMKSVVRSIPHARRWARLMGGPGGGEGENCDLLGKGTGIYNRYDFTYSILLNKAWTESGDWRRVFVCLRPSVTRANGPYGRLTGGGKALRGDKPLLAREVCGGYCDGGGSEVV